MLLLHRNWEDLILQVALLLQSRWKTACSKTWPYRQHFIKKKKKERKLFEKLFLNLMNLFLFLGKLPSSESLGMKLQWT